MRQISIFLENAKGRLAQVLDKMAELGVNIRALSLADTRDFGVLRVIVDDPESVAAKLQENHYVVKITPVWILRVPDRPGGLAGMLGKLVAEGVVVEYMYAFVETDGLTAQVVLRPRDREIMERAVLKHGLSEEIAG
ncbi:MAG: ACT domain-containing protein [Gracilibacteraceae bacterium]|jgi:hypothetical protein|nr:ACT domain-containing protein [Gracilibacteraceae bacterium]